MEDSTAAQPLDRIDRRILRLLQDNGRLSNADPFSEVCCNSSLKEYLEFPANITSGEVGCFSK